MPRTLTILGAAFITVFLGFASVQAEWVATTTSVPGTPEVQLVSHSPGATVIDLTVPGFYVEEVMEAGDLYHLLSFGDNAKLRVVGKPELPVVTTLVGIPDRSDVRVSVEVLETETLTGYNVWPAQELTTDEDATPPFTIDRGFYSQSTVYPDLPAVVDEPQIWRDMRLTRLEVRPIRCNPVTGELTVATKMRVTIDYFGINTTRQFTRMRIPITALHEKMYRAAVINFDHLGYPLDNGSSSPASNRRKRLKPISPSFTIPTAWNTSSS